MYDVHCMLEMCLYDVARKVVMGMWFHRIVVMDDNLAFTVVVSNFNIFSLTPVATSEGILVSNYKLQPDSPKMIFGFGVHPDTLDPTLLKINYPYYGQGPCGGVDVVVRVAWGDEGGGEAMGCGVKGGDEVVWQRCDGDVVVGMTMVM
ncbi:hypothetical protein Tco_0013620 [Tanacetum coccineum]